MAAPRTVDELTTIGKQAETLAARRKERPSTAHLLLAITGHEGAAAGLLDLHRVSTERLERAGLGALPEEDAALWRHLLQQARELAARTKSERPGSQHVLLAILSERNSSAFALLQRCGVDPGRLRTATMQVAVGAAAARRPSVPPAPSAPPAPLPTGQRPARSGRASAVAVSIVPTPRSALPIPPAPAAAPMPPPPPTERPASVPPPSVPTAPAALHGRLDERAVPVDLTPELRGPDSRRPEVLRREGRGEGRPGAGGEPARAPEVRGGEPARALDEREARASEVRAFADRPLEGRVVEGRGAEGRRRDEGARRAQAAAEERAQLDPQAYPLLSTLGRNLTLAALRREVPAALGREAEIERCLDVLAKRHANNPVLVGPPGVGKTTTLRGLAVVAASAAAGSLDDRIFVEVTAAELLAGTGLRGALAERLRDLRREVASAEGRVVLLIDDIHQLFGDGADPEAAGELRLALARGELPCVGACGVDDFRRVIEPDAALGRRLTAIPLDEPGRAEVLAILRGVCAELGGHHGVDYPQDVLAASVDWTVRYLPGRALPDKALAVLDLAGARARRRGQREASLEQLAAVVSNAASIPTERLLATDAERMLGLEQLFSEMVVGHAPALTRIARMLRRNAAGLRGRRPIGTFLLLGPTGVGKTETAKAIARALFHSADAMTRLDLAEFAEPHAVARLVGAPPGYLGHEAGGQLTEAVRRRPYQVVLLDEIEKAHRDVLEAFLGVFDEGRLTDGRGRTVDFTNTVLVLTSNLGAGAFGATASKSIGFGRDDAGPAPVAGDEAVVAAARESLPPELYNRLDEVMVFRPLSPDDVREIARRQLASLGATLERERRVLLVFDEAVLEALLHLGGYQPELGARPMRRAIARHVEGPLAELLLRGALPPGSTAQLEALPSGALRLSSLER